MLSRIRALLLIVAFPIAVTHAAYSFVGCGPALNAAKDLEAFNDPNDDLNLSKCRKQMRAAWDAGAAPKDAEKVYYACTEDAGLR